eukprot:SAG31_NODE_5035_length_2787_cov_2.005952_2_plen_114_part_00
MRKKERKREREKERKKDVQPADRRHCQPSCLENRTGLVCVSSPQLFLPICVLSVAKTWVALEWLVVPVAVRSGHLLQTNRHILNGIDACIQHQKYYLRGFAEHTALQCFLLKT